MNKKIVVLLFSTILFLGCVSSFGNNSLSKADKISQEKLEDSNSKFEEIEQKDYWTFTVGETSATSYDLEDLCGLVEPEGWQDYANFDDTISATSNLPDKWDWRQKSGVTPVKNQGSCGSCWAFGTVGILESAIKIKSGKTVDLSEQWLVSCNKDGWGCNGGWWAHAYHCGQAGSCGGTGAVLEENFPYTASGQPCNGPYLHNYLLVDTNGDGNAWNFVGSSRGIPSVEKIKQAIYDYGPVASGIYANNVFMAYTGGIYNGDHLGQPNHAINLVGWDDTQGKDGVWILKNSWGTNWGENGYMRIEYGCNNVGYAANYVDDYKSLSPEGEDISVKLHLHKLTNEGMDDIDLDTWPFDGKPEWYYKVGFTSNGETTSQTVHNKDKNSNDSGFWWEYKHEHTWNVNQDHIFYTSNQNVEVTIKLMDYDNLKDDLADVSAYPGGGSDDSTKDKREAIYHGNYNIITDELTGDKTFLGGSFKTTKGDGKNNAKVWLSVTDSYDADAYEPDIDVRPTTLNFGEVDKGSSPSKNIEIFNTAKKDPLGLSDGLHWSASTSDSWISLNKRSGSLSGGQSESIKVTLKTDNLQRGSSENGNVIITSNGGDYTLRVSVQISKPRSRSYPPLFNFLENILNIHL